MSDYYRNVINNLNQIEENPEFEQHNSSENHNESQESEHNLRNQDFMQDYVEQIYQIPVEHNIEDSKNSDHESQGSVLSYGGNESIRPPHNSQNVSMIRGENVERSESSKNQNQSSKGAESPISQKIPSTFNYGFVHNSLPKQPENMRDIDFNSSMSEHIKKKSSKYNPCRYQLFIKVDY